MADNMSMVISCNQCKKQYRFTRDKAGRVFRCSRCGCKQKIELAAAPSDDEDDWQLREIDFDQYESEKITLPERSRRKHKPKKTSRTSSSDRIVRVIGGIFLLLAFIVVAFAYHATAGMLEDEKIVTLSVYGIAPAIFISLFGVIMLAYGEEPDPVARSRNRNVGIKAIFYGLFLMAVASVIAFFVISNNVQPKMVSIRFSFMGLFIIGFVTFVTGLLSLVTGRNIKTIGRN